MIQAVKSAAAQEHQASQTIPTYTQTTTISVPYTQGPKSAHIAWRRQGALDGIFGGLIDGAYTQYQAPNLMYNNAVSTFQQVGPGQSGNPNLVFEGRCYQAITKPYNGITQTVWECYDIQTGQIYWDLTNVTRIPTLISFAENTPPVPGALGRTDRTVASLRIHRRKRSFRNRFSCKI